MSKRITKQFFMAALFVLFGLTRLAMAGDSAAPATPAVPAATAASATPAPAPAAPAPKWFEAVTVTGLVDAYFTYNGNGYRGFGDNQYLGFAPDSNEFSAALFELNFEKKPTTEHPTGFYVGLMEGTTAFIIDQAGDKTSFSGDLRQVYGSLLLSPSLQVDIGKYVTPFGAEVIESNANWNYTRSLLFSYAIPYTHTGARFIYTANDALYAQLHIANGSNNVINHTSGKAVMAQVGYTPTKALPIVINYMTSSESSGANALGQLGNIGAKTMIDAVVTYNVNDNLSFMLNYDNGSQSNGSAAGGVANWSGTAVYAKYVFAPTYTIALRAETFSDPDGFTTGFVGGQTLTEGTITLEKALEGALIRMDIRQDSSSQKPFTVAGAANSSSQLTATLGAVFTF